MPPKPLIDISALSPPSLPPLEMDRSPLPRPSPVEPREKDSEREKRDDHKETLRVPEAQEAPMEPEKETASVSQGHAKPSLNDRLARLAASVSAGRSNTLANPDEVEKAQTDRGRSPGPLAHPKRSQTLPVDAIVTESPSSSGSPMPPTPSPTRPKPNGRSYSTPNAYDGIQDLSDPKPIVPTPIRERSPPPSFSVTSRPTSQLSLASHFNFGAIRSEHSPTQSTSPPLTTAQARLMAARTPSPGNITSPSQTQSLTELRSPTESLPRPDSRPRTNSRTNPSPSLPYQHRENSKHDESPRYDHSKPLIPDCGMPSPKGFTGGGLLAAVGSTDAGRSSPASASSNSTAPSRTRRRSQTMEHISTLQPIAEPTAAPKPVRPRQFVSPNLPVSTSSESSQTSAASTSESAPSPRAAAPPAMTPAQQRARARTMEGQRDTLTSMPPVKPFAGGVRGYSPASSTGESSSSRTPITPQDEREVSFAPRERARARERPEGPRPGAGAAAAARRGHRKSSSLTFAEAEGQRSRAALAEREREEKERADVAAEEDAAEDRRRQRRRSEAKAALEVSFMQRCDIYRCSYVCASSGKSSMGGLLRTMTTTKTTRWTTCRRV